MGTFLADLILYQTHLETIGLIGAVGALFFLLKVAFPRLVARTRSAAFLNLIAIIFVALFCVNIGYYACDRGWGYEAVQKDREAEIERLQDELGH